MKKHSNQEETFGFDLGFGLENVTIRVIPAKKSLKAAKRNLRRGVKSATAKFIRMKNDG